VDAGEALSAVVGADVGEALCAAAAAADADEPGAYVNWGGVAVLAQALSIETVAARTTARTRF
jgi:hypothetical protein